MQTKLWEAHVLSRRGKPLGERKRLWMLGAYDVRNDGPIADFRGKQWTNMFDPAVWSLPNMDQAMKKQLDPGIR